MSGDKSLAHWLGNWSVLSSLAHASVQLLVLWLVQVLVDLLVLWLVHLLAR